MIRQVLYSWGILYFPWGREDGTVVAPGMRIADPLSGEWECVEIVAGANPGFDSAVFKYVPANSGFNAFARAYRQAEPALEKIAQALDTEDTAVFGEFTSGGKGPTGRVLPNGKICFNDPELPGIVQGLDEHPLRCDAGPETMPVNAATPDDTLISINFVRRHIEAHIKWSRHYETVCAFGHLKEALGL